MTTPANRFAPKCAHPGCGSWASWGYGCTKEIGSGSWYCGVHRPRAAAAHQPSGARKEEMHRPSDEMPKQFTGGLF